MEGDGAVANEGFVPADEDGLAGLVIDRGRRCGRASR
jgi:hypothetical protein